MVAMVLANTIGSCWLSRQTAVPSRIASVTAAAAAMLVKGSAM